MRTILQRVLSASVRVDGDVVGAIDQGVLLFVGVERGDSAADARATAQKIARLRVFAGRTPMDRTLAEVGGACLVVSQFTLAATLAKGNRPGLARAAEPGMARDHFREVVDLLRAEGLPVETGRFGAHMQVEATNDGPITLILETREGRVVDGWKEPS